VIQAGSDWTLLLIGGGSTTGKTTLATSLSRRLNVKLLDGDMIRALLLSNVSAEQDPDLHAFSQPELWDSPLDNRIAASFTVARRVCDRTSTVVSWHLNRRIPLIIEAVWLLPEVAQQVALFGGAESGQVRPLFLHDPDFDALRERLHQRLDWMARVAPREREPRIEMFYGFSQEVRAQAESLGLPVLESRPFETLEERALAALDIGR
jgi:2-phosphoglycerate kinase